MPNKRGKTICFIDNSNIFGGQYAAGWRVDWEKLVNKLEESGDIWQVHFFASLLDPPREVQTGFYKYLKDVLRWELHLYELGRKTHRCSSCLKEEVTPSEKGVDVGIATKLLMLGVNKAYDTAILMAGDRDYLETVKFVKNLGLRVEIVGWRRSMAAGLETESSAPVLYLDDIRDDICKD